MKSAIAFGVLALGLSLLVGATLWPTIFPTTSSWTPEKSERAAEIKARLNDLGPRVNSPRATMHGGADIGPLKAEFAALQKENDQLNADFQSAYDSPRTVSKVLKWSGIGLAVLGLIGWYAVKQTS
jgi:hypothetical protein